MGSRSHKEDSVYAEFERGAIDPAMRLTRRNGPETMEKKT
jgi:hypothetical protein